ncbi:protein-methionine-sulfoxide reductase catalytic subunit MsrP [Phyllobacterium lublinensis]|uniref:protein-methionine-sulfoxide reductase catalytic subunit MsrP n=1 Tax=Phyllobacterium lublinensis TaxID=2875708 RepID=UPI001CC9D573|nr:protein-methionine-sulfoxide reductase catalytic subunit MsrP [Phyllobacterium sp. 2063]MBZ9655427.1 protein-methionine-sulfoxide reductase catalytic subunit MsrP [Phyllobacterium sp. 2063]
MFAIHQKPSWTLAEASATPEDAFLNRRSILKAWGMGALAATGSALLPALANAQAAPKASGNPALYPAKRNEAYKLDRSLTPEEINSKYNNFYEFGGDKDIWTEAQTLITNPWDIEIDGMVDKPFTVAFVDLEAKIPLEERLYRHRCVEAWSMTIPWTGFPLAKLVELAKPTAAAKYIRFETFNDPSMASGQNGFLYSWPYVEGVTMAEAANDLAFIVTGAYGKPLLNQFGAPIRLALPWKYGFKSIKSIRKITFTDQRPVSFWEGLASNEYGFWANVNPEVAHPRWSQAQERVLHTGETVPTLLFNGYGEQVASLYAGLESEPLYR